MPIRQGPQAQQPATPGTAQPDAYSAYKRAKEEGSIPEPQGFGKKTGALEQQPWLETDVGKAWFNNLAPEQKQALQSSWLEGEGVGTFEEAQAVIGGVTVPKAYEEGEIDPNAPITEGGEYDPTVPMDPQVAGMLQGISGWGQEEEGEYAESLMKQSGAQLMAQMGDPSAQTSQQMGSRGMGRVAQLAQQSEATYLHELIGSQIAARETARAASSEVRTEMRELIDLNLKQQAQIHEWDDDERTHMANQYNEYMTAIENILGELSGAGALDTEAEWNVVGKRLKEANAAFAAATTDEERKQVTIYYWGEMAYVPAATNV